jgi:hypothetical protein
MQLHAVGTLHLVSAQQQCIYVQVSAVLPGTCFMPLHGSAQHGRGRQYIMLLP